MWGGGATGSKKVSRVSSGWNGRPHVTVMQLRSWWNNSPQTIDLRECQSVNDLNRNYGSEDVQFFTASTKLNSNEKVIALHATMLRQDEGIVNPKVGVLLCYVLDKESGKHKLQYIQEGSGGNSPAYSWQVHELVEHALQNLPKDLGIKAESTPNFFQRAGRLLTSLVRWK